MAGASGVQPAVRVAIWRLGKRRSTLGPMDYDNEGGFGVGVIEHRGR